MEIRLKNMKLKKLGGSYMFIVPKALVNTKILNIKNEYNIIIVNCNSKTCLSRRESNPKS